LADYQDLANYSYLFWKGLMLHDWRVTPDFIFFSHMFVRIYHRLHISFHVYYDDDCAYSDLRYRLA
jgi:hypothetical protein